MPNLTIQENGDLVLDGKTITPEQVSKLAPTITNDVEGVMRVLLNKKMWTWKNVEKTLVYGAGVVAATNGFSAAGLPLSIRGWLLAGSAIIIAAINHRS